MNTRKERVNSDGSLSSPAILLGICYDICPSQVNFFSSGVRIKIKRILLITLFPRQADTLCSPKERYF